MDVDNHHAGVGGDPECRLLSTLVCGGHKGKNIGCIVRDAMATAAEAADVSTGQFFHGLIDEVRISSAVLAPEEFLMNLVEEPCPDPNAARDEWLLY